MMKTKWTKWREYDNTVHAIEIDDEHTFHVYKTAGGDYAMVCYKQDDPCGGDPEYFDQLRDAKATAERIIKSGNWHAYTLDAQEE